MELPPPNQAASKLVHRSGLRIINIVENWRLIKSALTFSATLCLTDSTR